MDCELFHYELYVVLVCNLLHYKDRIFYFFPDLCSKNFISISLS